MLEVRGLQVNYGAVTALHGIDLTVNQGEIVALIGANGAGKTTALRTISGLITPRQGSVRFLGQEIAGRRADQVVRLGLSQVPEGRQVLGRMTVRENLLMGAFTRGDRTAVHSDLERVFTRFPRLQEREGQLADTLSGGEQQMLAMGRALMARPQLLLLDEPSMGLAPKVVADVLKLVTEVNRDGTTVLLVEQNARQALRIAQRAYVLELGRIAVSGSAVDVAGNPQVVAAYLGGRN